MNQSNNPRKFRKPAISNDALALLIYAAMTVFILIVATFLLVISITNTVNAIKTGSFDFFPLNIFSAIGDIVSGADDHPYRQDIKFEAPTYPDDLGANTNSDIKSPNFIAIDINENKVVQSKKSTGEPNRIYPASLTKVMTLIVVMENLKNEDSMQEMITVSEQTDNYLKSQGSSGIGLKAGESLTVETALYALILHSDGWSAITLAEYISGSESAFVELMNAKATEMGLADTHFTNCTGLHNPNHYSSAYDMAQIMMYAMKNTYCSNILRTKTRDASCVLTTGQTETFTLQHNLLYSKLGDGTVNPDNGKFVAGKTGWTGNESGYCLVSFIKVDSNGHEYVIVTTGNPKGTLDAVDEHILICETYFK